MLSLVIPMYNEEEVIPELLLRLKESSKEWGQYEVIFVDDGSTDSTPKLLSNAVEGSAFFRLIRFTRNFGHQIAVSAGLEHASGDCVAVMDGDLQDPPEVIGKFARAWKEGYEVVYGIRTARKEHIYKRVAYKIFYRI